MLDDNFYSQLKSGQLQQLFEYLPDVYFVVKDRSGKVIMANKVAARLCGVESPQKMIGKTDYDLLPREKALAYVRDDNYIFDTAESIIDRVEMAPDPNDQINWFLTTKIPLFSKKGDVIGLACIAKNMTHAHEKLRPYVEMNEALEYIRLNYNKAISVAELASLCNLSASQFQRRFRSAFHITPLQHLLNVRVEAACHLLKTTHDTIASIAQDTGFFDHSHMTRTFKKITGVSPIAYRKSA